MQIKNKYRSKSRDKLREEQNNNHFENLIDINCSSHVMSELLRTVLV